MNEVLVRKKTKNSVTLFVSDSSANIQATCNPPLYLQANRNHELAGESGNVLFIRKYSKR